MDTDARLNAQTHFRLTALYLIWSLLLIVLGTRLLLPVIGQIGETFGGFVYVYDPTYTPPLYIGPELWRTRPLSEENLRLLDHILLVDGGDPIDFEQVYDGKQVNEQVTYLVQRGEKQVTVREPVRLFTLDAFVVSHGLVYLTGVASILAGFVLLRGTHRKDMAILSFVFLAGAGAWLFHGSTGSLHRLIINPLIYSLLMWMPTLPLAGAILLHFTLIFPRPRRIVLRHPSVVLMPYLIAFILLSIYATTSSPGLSRINRAALIGMLVYASLAILTVNVAGIDAYRRARKKKNVVERKVIEAVAVIWIVCALVLCLAGMLPLVLFGRLLLPWEIWITFILLIPLALVYAVRNAEMVERLHHEIDLRQQYSDRVDEMRGIRERTLHEVSDALHDHVIPELRGLHFAATAAQRQASRLDEEALSDDLLFISDTLDTLSKEARVIMEGAKPVDWEDTELSQALGWLTTGLRRSVPGMVVKLDVEGYDENDDAVGKEALYWIASAALSNVQDHALATEVTVSLRSSARSTTLRIVDNGVGFDVQAANQGVQSERRHLGLTNMRLRAQEINARLLIDSQPGAGTQIEVTIPRGVNAP